MTKLKFLRLLNISYHSVQIIFDTNSLLQPFPTSFLLCLLPFKFAAGRFFILGSNVNAHDKLFGLRLCRFDKKSGSRGCILFAACCTPLWLS